MSLIFVLPTVSFAEWVLQTEYANIDTTDRFEISRSFVWVPNAMSYLTADELAASSKMVVTKAQVKVGLYDWKNDDTCTVADPSVYAGMRLEDYAYEFHYQDDPSSPVRLEGASRPALQCERARVLNQSKVKFIRN